MAVLHGPSPQGSIPASALPQPSVERPLPTVGRERAHKPVPGHSSIEAARGYADAREGTVAFAVVTSEGRLRGLERDRDFLSASVVKVMLLIAYLDRLEAAGEPLSREGRSLLTPMIEVSDNLAASQVYGMVGPEGLEDVARRAGMRRFAPSPAWGDSTITAGDLARLFARADRLVEHTRREYLRRLLSNVAPDQAWGIPAAAGERWETFFKGGWRPTAAGQLVHQAALLERGGRRMAIAVLSDGNPSFDYGVESVEGVAGRLLGGGS